MVFPTLVGVFPRLSVTLPARFCLPHARGGVSLVYNEGYRDQESSPRSWGCFLHADLGQVVVAVFPTLVGVFPSGSGRHMPCACLPHARGGVSPRGAGGPAGRESSPRSWGCFRHLYAEKDPGRVFPTLVGVFLCHEQLASYVPRLPHARGGVSSRTSARSRTASSSPRSWGCFQVEAGLRNSLWVFPTLVGVFLTRTTTRCWTTGLPHARGGVSSHGTMRLSPMESSPRSWGCFQLWFHFECTNQVFPTLVGVFLIISICLALPCRLPHARGGVSLAESAASPSGSLPHARGGVSLASISVLGSIQSSPRSWGCFSFLSPKCPPCYVFPTLVGVFPKSLPSVHGTDCLPHARGGVSGFHPLLFCLKASSPRSWGCFQGRGRSCCHTGVFPTLVGVFPKKAPDLSAV